MFILGSWYALLEDDTWEQRASPPDYTTGGEELFHHYPWADDADICGVLKVEAGSTTIRLYTSTDGGVTFSEDTGTLPDEGAAGGFWGIQNRGGTFYLLVSDDQTGATGGVYSSTDGLSWSFFGVPSVFLNNIWWGPDAWGATGSAIYFVQAFDAGLNRQLCRGSTATVITLPGGLTMDPSETPGSSQAWGSFAGDVFLFSFTDSVAGRVLIHVTGTTATNITPAELTADTVFFDLWSPDGDVWVGILQDNIAETRALIRTDDSGSTWSLVRDVAAVNYPSIVFDPNLNGTWWAIEDTGAELRLLKSIDDGATWAVESVNAPPFGLLAPLGGFCR